MGGGTTSPIKVPLVINDTPITMELDTGADITIISDKYYQEHITSTRSLSSSSRRTLENDSVIGTKDAEV